MSDGGHGGLPPEDTSTRLAEDASVQGVKGPSATPSACSETLSCSAGTRLAGSYITLIINATGLVREVQELGKMCVGVDASSSRCEHSPRYGRCGKTVRFKKVGVKVCCQAGRWHGLMNRPDVGIVIKSAFLASHDVGEPSIDPRPVGWLNPRHVRNSRIYAHVVGWLMKPAGR